MEKSAENQTQVLNENGELLMRLPGRFKQPYDNRYGDLKDLLPNHGDYKIFPQEDS